MITGFRPITQVAGSILLAATLSLPGRPMAALLLSWDFEGSAPTQGLKIEGNPPEIVADPLNPKGKVQRFVLPKGDDRAEVRTNKEFRVGDEFWIGVRILRPDSGQSGWVSLFQIGPARSPTTSTTGLHQLQSVRSLNEWKWRVYDVQSGGNGYAKILGSQVWGKWENWVFHCRYRADASGLIEVWKNGVLLHRQAGQNGIPNAVLPIKWGAYIGIGNQAEANTTVYFDDIRIGDKNSGFTEVDPAQKPLAIGAAGPARDRGNGKVTWDGARLRWNGGRGANGRKG